MGVLPVAYGKVADTDDGDGKRMTLQTPHIVKAIA